MHKSPQPKGTCSYCGDEVIGSAMLGHLKACAGRKAAIEAAEKKEAKTEQLYHLRVADADRPEFWLDLEMRGSATLEDLDHYLRAIWLECCGHMSKFETGGAWSGNEISKRRKIKTVFDHDVEVTHLYDFGTTSETIIKPVGKREGKPASKRPIALMARNNMPDYKCMECGKPAEYLCMECQIENDKSGTLCEKHAQDHPHDEYGEPMPLVNSPRLGMCGYEGPANPPY